MAVDIATLGIEIKPNGADRAGRELREIAAAGGKAESAVGLLKSAMGGLAAGLASLGLAATARELIQVADAWSTMNSQVRLVSASTQAAAATMSEILSIANRSRTSIAATTELYTKLARTTGELGLSQSQVARITETVAKSLTISGTSAAAASGALTQLGQAFASGTLRGDELNSILEGTPRLAQAIADGMGIPIGKLRELGAEGQLTAAKMAEALLSASNSVEDEFGQMATTVEQAMTVLSNSFISFVGYLNETSGVTPALTGLIAELASQIDNVRIAMDNASSAYNTAIGNTANLTGSTFSLAEVVRTVAETFIVLAANVGYVFRAIAKDVASLIEQGKALARLDLAGMKSEAKRRTIEADADRRAVDAFSESILSRERAIVGNIKATNAAEQALGRLGATTANVTGKTRDQAAAQKVALDTQLEYAKASDIVAINLDSVAVQAIKVSGEIQHVSDLVGEVRFETWVDEIDAVSEAFQNAAWAADGVFRAIDEKDWAGALGGVIRLVQQLAESLGSAGSMAQKIGTVGGTLGGIGQAVGGRAGSIISGVGSAASLYGTASMAGTALINAGSMGSLGALSGPAMGLGSILGPLGAVVGIASLFMKDDSAKKAQAYADAIKANQAALDAMNQKRELELQLMEAQGKTAEALAFRRADELAAMDAASAAMQAQIWALEDLAAATEKANSAYDDAVSTANAMVDAARSDLVDAYNEEASALKSTIDTFSRLVETLRAFGDSLTAQAASVASPLVAYRQAQGAFRSVSTSTDPNVLANLPAAGQAYLQAALAIAPDKTTYQRVLAEVRRATAEAEKTAEKQKTIAEQQLDELKTQVSLLVSIDKGIMSVSAAIAALAAAQTAAAAQIAAAASARDAAVAAANDNGASMWSAAGYAAKNPDVAAWAQSVLGTKGYDGQVLSTVDQALSYHWLNHGKFEGRSFATGGSFTVGGASLAGDRVPVAFMANSGEHVNVSRQDSMARVAAAQERQNALLAEQNAELRKTREATERTERLFKRLSEGGAALKTVAA